MRGWIVVLLTLGTINCASEPVAFSSHERPDFSVDSVLAVAVRDAVTAEELFFSDNNKYTMDLPVVTSNGPRLLDVVVRVVEARPSGYAVVGYALGDPSRICIFATMGDWEIEALWAAGFHPQTGGGATACMFPEMVQCFTVDPAS
jgi:hypothetical protein